MRLLKNIFWATAATIAAVSCSIVSEDTFSSSPVAPVLDSHTDILITEGTKSEDVTFSWTKARFIDADEILYDVYVSAEDKDVLLAKDVKNTYYTTPKESFRSFLIDNFNFVKNTTHSVSVFVTVSDRNGVQISSSNLDIKVYYYEDAVPSEVTPAITSVVLDKSTPSENVALLSWSEARLIYGEDVSYKVTLSVGEGEETVLASGLFDTSFAMTVDALNEAAIAAGAAEAAESELTFKVYACCESLPEGVVSNEAKITVTTYIATFPDAMWLPGSYQGWAPATAPSLKQSAKTKGLYQGFVDLTTAEGADVMFKFSPNPRWEGDFGFSDVTVETKGSAELSFAVASAATVSGDNIVVPSGIYYIKLDKKFGTLTMIQTKNLELIGGWVVDWSDPVEMTWDGKANTWTATRDLTLVENTEFKIRFNSNWDYSFGGEMSTVEFGGGNIKFTKADGTYKMIFNVGTSDFNINALDLNMPDYLVLPGDYSGHSWDPANDFRVYLKDSNKGTYIGAITMYASSSGFKVAKAGQWIGVKGNVADGYQLDPTFGDGKIEDGTYAWTIDLSTMTAVATPVTKVGMIGAFNGWGGDVEMTFDPETLTYKGELTLEVGQEWKFRFNGGWDFDYGLNDEGILVNAGGNIKATEAGTFEVVLDMAHGSYATYTMTKK